MDEQELLGNYKLVLGMEIHLHLNTDRKMFCRCSADIWGKEPNTITCPVCLGLPGALPVPNFDAVQKTQMLGLALGCTLNKSSKFDRKHYFYPDLPKGYQISQYKEPLCFNGKVELDSGNIADVERVHLEEDVAKSFHEGAKTLVDFNKSGVPLVEVVTRPCFRTVSDAVDYCKKIQQIVRFLGIGEADMEKGQMRLEVNLSLRTAEMEKADKLPDYKVEVKNINSFKFMEKAAKSEIVRQKELLDKGERPAQENRGFKENQKGTVSQRSKEEAKDYRYFPEPDIPPMEFDDQYISELKAKLPKLPQDFINEMTDVYKVTKSSAKILVENLGSEYIEKFRSLVSKKMPAETAVNILVNKPELRDLSAEEIIKNFARPTTEIDNTEMQKIIEKVLSENSKAVEDYKKGKEASVQFLIGCVMRELKQKTDTVKIRELLITNLKK